MASTEHPAVAFIGLGAMGVLMARHLCTSGFPVTGYDLLPAAVQSLVSVGGKSASSPAEVAATADIVILMVATADQITSAMFAPQTGVVHGLRKGATLIAHGTVPPTFPAEVQSRLSDEYGRGDVAMIDAPVSGGTARAVNGTLSIMVSSDDMSSLERPDAQAVLECMAGTVYPIPGGLGSAMKVKVLNQLLCGIHIVDTSEILGFAAVLGLSPRALYEHVTARGASAKKTAAWNWMFEDRGPRMLQEKWMPCSSAVSIILKDVNIVVAEAKRVGVLCELPATAKKVLDEAVAQGLVREDDSGVVRVYTGTAKWTECVKLGVSAQEAKEKELTNMLCDAMESIHLLATFETLVFARGLGMMAEEAQIQQWFGILAGAAGASTIFSEIMPKLLKDPTRFRTFSDVLEQHRDLAQRHLRSLVRFLQPLT